MRRRVYVRIEYGPELRAALRQIERGEGVALLANLLELGPEVVKGMLNLVQSSLHLAPTLARDFDGGFTAPAGDRAAGR